jgi:hypothetical protein
MGLASAILDQAIRRLNELSTTSPVRWTRAELLVFFNDGMAELNLIAADFQEVHQIPIDNTDNVWDLPEEVIGPFSVRTDSGGYVLRQFTEDMDKESNWENPTIQRLHPKSWSTLGLTKVIITPRVSQATTLYVEALTQYSSVPDASVDMIAWIRPEYEIAIEDFIVSRAMFKEGGAEAVQALSIYARFLDTVQQLSGRNIIRRYPAWDVGPEAMSSETSLRRGVEGAK